MTQIRLENLRKKMDEASLDAFLVSKPENWRFVSGFTGDSGVLLIHQRTVSYSLIRVI